MEGETVTLKEHFDALRIADEKFHSEREKRYLERFEAQEKSLDRANEYLKEYKNQANEWRGQSKDVIATRVSTNAFDEYKKATESKFDAIEKVIQHLALSSGEIKGRKEGVSATWGVILTLVGLLIGAGIMRFLS